MSLILLVEDNEMNRDMLSRRLRRAGFEVIEATDGAQGCQMACERQPDLVLLDMSLPVMDGWTAARQMKATAATAAMPIIALTAHALEVDRVRALESGCDDYDTKPVEFKRLQAKMARLLDGSPELKNAGPAQPPAPAAGSARPSHE